jgi:fatty-acyl-CoA synthase
MKKSTTVAAILDRASANADPDVGIHFEGRFHSYADIASDARRIAGGLLANGVSPGDHVALWSPNTIDFVTAFFACQRVGCPTMLVNTKLSSIEMTDIVERSGSKVLIYHPDHADSGFRGRLERADWSKLAAVRLVVELHRDGPTGSIDGVPAITFGAIRSSRPQDAILAMEDALAVMFSTSGSTGPSKLVMHTNRTLTDHAWQVVSALGYERAGTVHFIPVPLAGAYGMTQLLSDIASCQRIVLMDRFDGPTAAELMQRHRVTNMHVVDDVIIRLFEVCDEERPFPDLRMCGYSAFNLGYRDFAGVCERRGIPIVGLFGSSEMQGLYMVQPIDAPIENRKRNGGFTLATEAAFRIRDVETGDILTDGRSGEIEVSGPSRFVGYLGDPVASRRILEDGFYRTGDTGHCGPDGSLVFEARIEEVLRLGGFMVPVADIEGYIAQQDGIETCNVVAVQTSGGMRPVAFLTLEPGARFDAEQIHQACVEKLAKYKVPIAFHVLDAVPMGKSLNAPKVDKKYLRDLAQQCHDAS